MFIFVFFMFYVGNIKYVMFFMTVYTSNFRKFGCPGCFENFEKVCAVQVAKSTVI